MNLDPHCLRRLAKSMLLEGTAETDRARALPKQDPARVPHLALASRCFACASALTDIAEALLERQRAEKAAA